MAYLLFNEFDSFERTFSFVQFIVISGFVLVIVFLIINAITKSSNNAQAKNIGAIMLIADEHFDGVGLILDINGESASVLPLHTEKKEEYYKAFLAIGIEYEYTNNHNNGTSNTTRDHLLKNFQIYYDPNSKPLVLPFTHCARYDVGTFYGAFIKDDEQLKRWQ